MLFLSPRFEDERKNDFGGTFPGGTIVRANHLVRPDFLISWPNKSINELAEDASPCSQFRQSLQA